MLVSGLVFEAKGGYGGGQEEANGSGALDPARYENYLELQRELRHLEKKQKEKARKAERKQITLAARKRNRGMQEDWER